MSGYNNAAKVNDSLETNLLVACCDVDTQLLKLGFELVSPGKEK